MSLTAASQCQAAAPGWAPPGQVGNLLLLALRPQQCVLPEVLCLPCLLCLLCLQLDLEMSWMDRDSIMGLVEQMVATVFKQVGQHSSHIMPWRFGGEEQLGTPGPAALTWQPGRVSSTHIWRALQVAGVDVSPPFQRLSYADAIGKYASDKPDLRYGLEMAEVTEAVRGCGFR